MGDYLLLGLVVAYVGWRVLSVVRVRRQLPALRAAGAQVVDVRSLAEFAGCAPQLLDHAHAGAGRYS